MHRLDRVPHQPVVRALVAPAAPAASRAGAHPRLARRHTLGELLPWYAAEVLLVADRHRPHVRRVLRQRPGEVGRNLLGAPGILVLERDVDVVALRLGARDAAQRRRPGKSAGRSAAPWRRGPAGSAGRCRRRPRTASAGRPASAWRVPGAAISSADRTASTITIRRGRGERQVGVGVEAAHFADKRRLLATRILRRAS